MQSDEWNYLVSDRQKFCATAGHGHTVLTDLDRLGYVHQRERVVPFTHFDKQAIDGRQREREPQHQLRPDADLGLDRDRSVDGLDIGPNDVHANAAT